MASAVSRSIVAVRSTGAFRRLFSSTASKSLSLNGFSCHVSAACRDATAISHSIGAINPNIIRFTTIRCRVNRSGSAYSPSSSGSNFSDRPPTEMAPLFPGCDYEH